MPNHVTPELFVSIWKEAWGKWSSKFGVDWVRDYEILTKRTNYMLGDEGFLGKVANILKNNKDLEVYEWLREFMYLDFVCIGRENALPNRDTSHALYLPLILEHENTGDIREEMWKLCIYRSPLKVLVFYDYDEYQKTNNESINWLKGELQKVSDIRDKFDGTYGENSATRYLFIVGNREERGGDTRWRYFSDSTELKIVTEQNC